MVTTEDKLKIAARAFFTDNQDQYEDYHEALSEFISGSNQSETFIEFCVEPYIKPEDGHAVLVRDDAHVATVRMSDGLFTPRTEMSQGEGEKFEADYEKAMD